MGDNYFADWTSQADEERKHRAWEALAAPKTVDLPEVTVVGDPRPPAAAPSYDQTPPEADITPGTDAQASPDMPPDAPPLARLGASLRQRDSIGDAPPAPARSESTDSGGDGKTNWTGTALAALADILLNHGRGVGGVLALGAAGQSPMAKAELDLKRAQAEHLRNPTYGRETDPQVLELRKRALDLQESGQKGAEARAAARAAGNDPDGKKAAALLGFYGAHGIDTSGMESLDYSTLIKVRPDISKMFTNALAPETNKIAADRAGGVAEAQIEPHVEQASQISKATLPDKIAIAEAGQSIRDNSPAQKRADDKETRAAADQFAKETGYSINMLNNAARIESVLSKYKPGTVPGIGQLEGRTPDMLLQFRAQQGDKQALDAMEIRNAKNTMGELAQRKESGAAGPEAERYRYMARVGAADGASEEQFKLGLEATKKLSEMEVKRFAAGKGNAAREVLRSNGLEHLLDGDSQPTDAQGTPGTKAIDITNPTPSASPAKGDYANYSRDTSDPLPTTKGKPPPIPGAEQRTRHVVHTPNGDEAGDLTQDEVLAFRRKGLRVD